MFFHVLREAVESLLREVRRIAPMAAGIVWGVASIFLLASLAKGFEKTQRQAIEIFGDQFLLLRLNKPTHSRGDPEANRRILVDAEDIEKVRAGAPAVEWISPKGYLWFANASREGKDTYMSPVGVDPEYAQICNVPLEPGSRWIDRHDVEQANPVVVIGPRAKADLFGDEPALGQKIKVSCGAEMGRGGGGRGRAGGTGTANADPPQRTMRELTVIGVIRDVELSDEFYVSNKGVGFVPYTVFERMSELGAGFMVMRPRSPGERDVALAQMREVLGERYHFSKDDQNTVLPYFDAIERGQKIDRVFGGIRLFLGAVGLLILLLGAVGVANVVLMSVTARTFEFGLRRALGCGGGWIFLQVFVEAFLVCTSSGVLGFLIGLGSVQVVAALPLPQGFAHPVADLGAATIPGLLLLAVTLCAATWPALRAVRLDPVAALRGSAL